MHTAAVTSIQPSNSLSTRPSVVAAARLGRRVSPPPERMWAAYKPPPWWTTVVSFVISIAIHLGAVAILETGPDGRLARIWENRVLGGEEVRLEERASN